MNTFFKTQVFSDINATANRLAMDLIRYIEYNLRYRERIYIALSGGNTPQAMFSIIAKEFPQTIDWKRIHFFWVDERCVPFESNESNYGNAYRILFSKIDIPKENLHPIHGGEDPLHEVVRYTGEILAHIPCSGKYPVFDVIILGMGNDGHTASIFPGQLDLFETSSLCSVSVHPETNQNRITLTGKVINNAQEILFLITGDSKAETIKSIFEETTDAYKYPAKKIRPVNGKLSWYMDKEAVKFVDEKSLK
jgi:6-phosphogluconolactonase